MNPLNYMRLHDYSSRNSCQHWINASNGKIRPVALPWEEGPALACALHDLSLSGVCLTVNAAPVAERLNHHLVRLTIPLPSASQALPGWASVSLTLQLLGVVRNVSHTPSGRALHIRFLKRLLPEVDTLLWHLEGGFAEQADPGP